MLSTDMGSLYTNQRLWASTLALSTIVRESAIKPLIAQAEREGGSGREGRTEGGEKETKREGGREIEGRRKGGREDIGRERWSE